MLVFSESFTYVLNKLSYNFAIVFNEKYRNYFLLSEKLTHMRLPFIFNTKFFLYPHKKMLMIIDEGSTSK